MYNILLGNLLLACFAQIECASIVGHGTDVYGHMVPVKCTVNCETQGPSIGPVIPHLPQALEAIYPESHAPVPAEGTPASSAPVVEPTVASLPLYHKGFYAGLGSSIHPYWGDHGVLGNDVLTGDHGVWGYQGLWGHHGQWNHHESWVPHGYWGQHDVLANSVVKTNGLGGYATGPIDVNGDGKLYTGPEDDHSPIVGGPVYHSVEDGARWHGPYQGPLVHAPVGGYREHQILPDPLWGPFEYSAHGAVAHPGIVTSHGPSGVMTNHGPAIGFRPHLPASTHFGVVNANDLVHRKLGVYAIGDLKNLEIENGLSGLGAILFDKSSKSLDAEATPVAKAESAETTA